MGNIVSVSCQFDWNGYVVDKDKKQYRDSKITTKIGEVCLDNRMALLFTQNTTSANLRL